MTTIILTIIGILLAAAAALMVIFYGGDAFNSGSIRAQANEYVNAGQNYSAAYKLYVAENGSAPAMRSILMSPGPNGAYIKTPQFSESVQYYDGVDMKFWSWRPPVIYIGLTGPNNERLCRQINRDVGRNETDTSYESHQRGCRYGIGSPTPGYFFFYYI